jgi:hypothetical protein
MMRGRKPRVSADEGVRKSIMMKKTTSWLE